MITTVPITKMRVNLGAFVKRARLNKESFILEKDGFPVAGLVDIDLLEDILELSAKRTKKDLSVSLMEYKKGKAKDARLLLK